MRSHIVDLVWAELVQGLDVSPYKEENGPFHWNHFAQQAVLNRLPYPMVVTALFHDIGSFIDDLRDREEMRQFAIHSFPMFALLPSLKDKVELECERFFLGESPLIAIHENLTDLDFKTNAEYLRGEKWKQVTM